MDPAGGACPWAGQRPDPGDAGKKIKGKKSPPRLPGGINGSTRFHSLSVRSLG